MKQPHGPPMTLANMRDLGVQRLIASCLNDACRRTALSIELSGRARSPVFQKQSGLRQVRQPAKQDRPAAELERAADAAFCVRNYRSRPLPR
jgi:hypothetical protein